MADRHNYVFTVDTNIKGLQFIVRHQEYINTYGEDAPKQESRTEIDIVNKGAQIGTVTFGYREDAQGRALADMLAAVMGNVITRADMPKPAEDKEFAHEAP